MWDSSSTSSSSTNFIIHFGLSLSTERASGPTKVSKSSGSGSANHRPLTLQHRGVPPPPSLSKREKQLDHFYNSWVRPGAWGPERFGVPEVLHALAAWSRPGPARSTGAEVWAGDVSRPLWSIKDLWICGTSPEGGLPFRRGSLLQPRFFTDSSVIEELMGQHSSQDLFKKSW